MFTFLFFVMFFFSWTSFPLCFTMTRLSANYSTKSKIINVNLVQFLAINLQQLQFAIISIKNVAVFTSEHPPDFTYIDNMTQQFDF